MPIHDPLSGPPAPGVLAPDVTAGCEPPTSDPPSPEAAPSNSEGAPDPSGKGPARSRISDKQQAANEENSKKSTGPRTSEGKKRSSRNAQGSGTWAREITPITKGPFAEDPAALKKKVRKLFKGLEPTNDFQAALAKRVVSALVRLDRADELETALLMGVTRPEPEEIAVAGDADQLELERGQVQVLLDSLLQITSGAEPTFQFLTIPRSEEPQEDWRYLAVLLRKHSPDPDVGVRDTWTDEITPSDDVGWKRAVVALYGHHWEGPDDFKGYLLRRWFAYGIRADEARVTLAAASARRQLTATDDLVNRPRTAAWKDFERALKAYQQMRARDASE